MTMTMCPHAFDVVHIIVVASIVDRDGFASACCVTLP